MRRTLAAAFAAAAALVPTAGALPDDAPEETLLLQDPAVSADSVVFRYAADLWVAPRSGGDAIRLTSARGEEADPAVSPDGKWVAFSAHYEGNRDAYLLPIGGGTPRRLTWHPGDDRVLGWHPDGKRVTILSARESGVPAWRPFLVSVEGGGLPEALPIPRAAHAAWRGDGARLAYTPIRDAFRTWKRYRGGRTGPVWIWDPATGGIEEVPHERATDTFPCWAGETVYFASDRDGTMNVWKFRPGAEKPEQVTRFRDFDVRNMSAGGGVVAFERAGAIHLLDPATDAVTRLRIRVRDDGLARNARWESAEPMLRDGAPSPNGKRVLVEARGEIFSVPREHGEARALTQTPGAHDRSPVWSPDGERAAWLSDAGGEYRLLVGDPLGRTEPRAYDLGAPRWYFEPAWSPDGKRILFTDKGNRIAFVTLESGEVTEVARAQGSLSFYFPAACWSPDSNWIAFDLRDPATTYDRVALYELATGKVTSLTDGFATAFAPSFSRDGKLLFFVASVDSGPGRFGLDLSASTVRDPQQALYAAVLRRGDRGPLAPKSDEAKEPDSGKEAKKEDGAKKDEGAKTEGEAAKEDGAKKEEAAPGLDLEGLDQRIVALPGATGSFIRLFCTKDRLFLIDGEPWEDSGGGLRAYDLEAKKLETVVEGIHDAKTAATGDAVLWRKGTELFLADGKGKDPKKVPLGGLRVRVDPAAEWGQILREVWRLQRDWFYDPNLHGVDWPAMLERWSPFLAHVRHRDDLNVVIAEMMGELACGHEYLWGGDAEKPPEGATTGLLGADWEAVEGRYRLRRVLRGQNWNAGLRAPLTEPGVDAREGDFLISVDGRPVTTERSLHAAFEGTAGRQLEVAFSAKADGSDPRTSKVVPVDDESRLRRLAWVEERRALVDRLSGGTLAYVYMPDTGKRGLAAFERDFYSQVDRKGLVLDERYNGGGKVADHVVEVLSRRVHCWWLSREGWVGRTPWGMIDGPKVMVINEYAGSGGDAMPWMFRRAGLGPLVGTRTWGGLVGISWYPTLVDGGRATAAAFGVLDPEGRWAVENEGVAPDHEVIETPRDFAEGRDPQLEKAVALALEAMKTWKYAPRPAYAPPAAR